MIRLRVEPPQGPSSERVFDQDSVVIGRASDADLALPDRFLSRRHARIFREGDAYLIEDLGSRNGTQVNGTTIEEATRLVARDVVRLSASALTVVDAGGETAGPDQLSRQMGATVVRHAAELVARQSSSETSPLADADSLRQLVARLEVFNDVHRALAESVELEDLLELILDRVCSLLRPEDAVIFLRQRDGSLEQVAHRGAPEGGLLSSETLARRVVEEGVAALVLDTQSDEHFASAKSIIASGVRSLVAAPLLASDGSSRGMIALGSRLNVRQFSEDDMELLASLAAIAAMRLRDIELTRESVERQRLQQELDLARRIQVALLPACLPEVPGFSLHAGNLPSRGASGDYYEILTRRDGAELAMVIADVSGKGMAASLLTASLEALAAEPIESDRMPAEICTTVGARLHRRTLPEKYATAIIATIDVGTGLLTCANAGHNPAILLRRDGSHELIRATGVPLGILPNASYRSSEHEMRPGDTLVLYTDGFTEAENAQDEEYGLDRLVAVCQASGALTVAELASAIEHDLDAFVEGRPYADDRTIVLVRRDGAPAAATRPSS